MIVYPAIDIRSGRCVRLVEGDFAQETVFNADPTDVAVHWTEAGARWLHIVDLDGAVAGEPVNHAEVRRIRERVSATVRIQLGGGLRTEAHLESAFQAGVDRCILGTAALETPDLVSAAVGRWRDRIAVALDARDGKLAAGGWLQQTEVNAVDLAIQLQAANVAHLVFTDIRRDGTLNGPNIEALRGLVEALSKAKVEQGRDRGAQVIAAGGVGSPPDITAIRQASAAGVIIGRALYDGRVSLEEAIQLAGQNDAVEV
jgi:phosphoribosylformimino-5-aminoimidazole carboxamide ribotide isomerase